MMTHDIADGQVDEDNLTGADEEEDPKEALKKVIDVKISDAGVLRRNVSITVPQDSLKAELDKDYKELINEAVVPGFRRGRAPRRLVEKRFGREVNDQVQTRILSNAYLAAIEKEDLKVLGDPLVWVQVKDKKGADETPGEQLLDFQSALQHMSLPEEGDFSFRCEVEVKPEFELPELEGVQIEKPDLKIDDEDVQVQIDRIRAQRGHWVPVEDGGKVEIDDMLVCDMKMTVDGTEVKTTDNMPLAARAQMIEGAVISDLGERLKGLKVGESATVESELPDDYELEAHRGKKASFELLVNEIKRMQLPPLDKEYLSSQGFDSEEEYRSLIKKQMESRLEHEIRRGMRDQAREYLLEKTKIDLPEGLSSRQTERAVERRMVDLRMQGVPMSEIEKNADELRTGAREQAVAELKLHFILEEIAEKLDIDVKEEEINGRIAEMAQAYNQRFDRVRDQLSKNNGLVSVYLQLRDEKCIDHILEKARITEAKTPKKAAKKTKKKTTKTEKTKKSEKAADADETAKKKTAKKKTTKKKS